MNRNPQGERVQASNILQVNTSDVGGGAELVAKELHEAYLDRGLDAWLAVGHERDRIPQTFELDHGSHRPAPARASIAASELFDGWAARSRTGQRVQRLVAHLGQPGRRIAMERGLEDFDFPATAQLLDLPPERPDVLHLHNLHGAYFDLRELPSLSEDVPTFVTLHDTWLLTGHCGYFIDCDRWRRGCGSCPDLERYPGVKRDATHENWMRKRSIFSSSRLHVATPSEWLASQVRQSILADAVVDLRVIPYGIDTETFCADGTDGARSRLDLPVDADVLLFVAHRMKQSAYKDPATVFSAVDMMLDQDRERPLIAVGIGSDGPSRRSGTSEVRFVGEIRDRRLLADWYRAADVKLHAAHADNFPLTVLEAQACGTPVVATGVGGVPEQIRGLESLRDLHPANRFRSSEATGALVGQGDAAGLAQAAGSILDDRNLLEALRHNAAEHAAREYRMDRQVSTYLEWYATVLSSKPDVTS